MMGQGCQPADGQKHNASAPTSPCEAGRDAKPQQSSTQEFMGHTVRLRAGRALRPLLAARIMQPSSSCSSRALPAGLPSSKGLCTASCQAARLLPQGCCTQHHKCLCNRVIIPSGQGYAIRYPADLAAFPYDKNCRAFAG